MEDETEFVKLPIEDRCVHKLWKARVHGYEEAKKLFQQIADEKSPEWNKFLGLVKKFVIDSNAVAQEKGLEAVLAFVENSHAAGKTVNDVMSGIVAKCIGAPKAKTKDLAAQISLMYIEIEKQDFVMEELLKGTEHKNPKVSAACINVMTQAIREFGVKAINIKPILKKIPPLLEDRDKTVREEGKTMVVEIYRWIGPALNPQLGSVKPVQMTELETEFQKVKGDRAIPTRYLRSQQAKQAKIAAETANDPDGDDEDADDGGAADEIDAYELMEPVDILSKLPKDFYEKIDAKKWQERKEAMDTLEGLLKSAPKLENGDYFELVKTLKKIISKDSNVVVVTLAGKNLASLANGMKKRFQQYAASCVSVILEKFREKKASVVAALREAIDAVYMATTLEAIQEDVIGALDNKNPSVKSETASFLARCFTKCTPIILNKKILKAYSTALVKTLNEPDPTVRDSSADALGTAMKVVGEKALLPFIGDVDALKMSKIKEFHDKAEIVVKQPKAVPKAADVKVVPSKTAGSVAPKPVKRPQSSTTTKKVATNASVTKKASTNTGGSKSCKSSVSASAVKLMEREMSEEEVMEKAEAVFPSEILTGLIDSNWKTRLSAVEQFSQAISTLDQSEVSSQLLFKIINKKPGVKDTNIQVAKLRLEAIKNISSSFSVSSVSMSCVLLDVAERLNDPKLSSLAAECLTAFSEAVKLDVVSSEVLDYAFNSQKSPKVQVEVLAWLSNAIQEFGFQVQPKVLMEHVRKGVGATNPLVRTASISLVGTIYVYMGPQLALFFENEKPALLQQINAEFEKHAGMVPKSPVRGVRKAHSQGDLLNDMDEGEEGGSGGGSNPVNIRDIVPRTDISSYITDALVSELIDKNWKVRAEALQKLQNIVTELRFISGSLGEAGPALAARLVDSNSKIAASALALCQQIGTAYGSSCKQYIRIFFPGFLQGMGDSKAWIRTAAVNSINTYGDLCGYKEFFDGEMIFDALKGGTPTLRSELWAWLAEKLPTIKTVPKDELIICLPLLYNNLEDRNVDVRKNASEAVVGVMTHVGYTPMMSACEKIKPASAAQIRGILDKARCSLPEKPLSKAKSTQGINKVGTDNRSKMQPGSSNTIVKSSSKGKVNPNVKNVAGSNRKKEEDNDSSAPLLQINNQKNQRCIDEQKLKTLKWNFTTPREEFVDLLRDQMTSAGVNKTLIANMFHADFKYHLRAIDSLSEDLPNNQQSLISNLDLILKWLTLRFFDTNPSVILKGLEYLQTVFAMLIEGSYTMLETEASSFIPYLVLKVGDPKDTVRNSVRVIFKQISLMYPVTKLFTYIMDGLKSKNARQRSECLEQLGYLIDTYGTTVCQPTPAAALKEIARHISDRDNSVRNGALNCVVSAHFLDGERVLKMVGNISDKDMSLLEERIKRAARTRVVASVKPMVQQQPQQHMQSRPISAAVPRQSSPVPDDDNEEEEQQEYVQQNHQQQITSPSDADAIEEHDDDNDVAVGSSHNQLRRFTLHFNEDGDVNTSIDSNNNGSIAQTVSGPYGLDLAFLANIESVPLQYEPPKLVEFDLRFLAEPSTQITSPLRLTTTSISPLSKMTHPATVEWHLSQIANTNLEKALAAMGQIETILLSEQRNSLLDHIDLFVTQLVNQLVLLNQCNHPDIVNCYRTNFGLFMKLYNYPELCYKVSESVLQRAVDQLLCLLTEKKLEMYDHTEMFARVVNSLVLRILERSDRTSVVCALLKLLYYTVNNTATTQLYQELVMKCLWKVIKNFVDWDKDLDYDRILTDIHTFLKDFPSSWWKKQPQDTPLRTVKTVLHTMVKLRGTEILVYVRQVKAVTPDSEIQIYCNKLVRTIKPVDHAGDGPPAEKKENNRPRHMSKVTYEQLSEIFLKIGSKNETKEGLRLLYEFKQLHPEADIEPFLEKSTKFFQDYIQRGLQAIEMEQKRANSDKNVQSIPPRMIPVVSEKGEGEINNKFDRDEEDSEMQQFVRRLRILQAKAGWSSTTSSNTSTTTTTTTASDIQLSQNSNVNNDIDSLPIVRNTSMESNAWKSPERTIDEDDVASIRQRLEKLKMERASVNL